MMNIEQVLVIMPSHSLVLGGNIETVQRTAYCETHGGRVNFPFVFALISIIFTNIDLYHVLNFTIIEPGAGDCTFSITIWLICHYLFRSTPRVIAIEIYPAHHTASPQWLHHYLALALSPIYLIICHHFL